jgi:hypothetical protein
MATCKLTLTKVFHPTPGKDVDEAAVGAGTFVGEVRALVGFGLLGVGDTFPAIEQPTKMMAISAKKQLRVIPASLKILNIPTRFVQY